MRAKNLRLRVTAFTLGLLLAVALSVAALAALVWFAGTNAGLMSGWMLSCAPPERTKLPAELYAPLCAALTDYLRGGTSVFDFMQGGISLFGTNEKLHLADCAALFRFDRTLMLASAGLAAALLIAVFFVRNGKSAAAGMTAGTLLSLAAVLALGVWGLADFDGLFVTFHRVAFTNDLWLMNPATDLILRLMPTGFFVRYALLIGGGWLLALGLLFGLSRALARRMR